MITAHSIKCDANLIRHGSLLRLLLELLLELLLALLRAIPMTASGAIGT